jgi:hypothetical protein
VVTSRFIETFGKGVGDRLTLHLISPEQAEDPNAQPPPAGPKVEIRIVGVVRSPWFSDAVGDAGSLIPSGALFQRYPANFVGSHPTYGFVNALVLLKGSPIRLGEVGAPPIREPGGLLISGGSIRWPPQEDRLAHSAAPGSCSAISRNKAVSELHRKVE